MTKFFSSFFPAAAVSGLIVLTAFSMENSENQERSREREAARPRIQKGIDFSAPMVGPLDAARWLRLPDLPSGRRAHASEYFETENQKWIFIFGGYNSQFEAQATVLRYDIRTGVWQTVSTIPSGPRVWGTAVRVKDRIYLVGGGSSSTSATAAVDVYDPVENFWVSGAANLPGPVIGNTAVAWRDSLVYVLGGSTTLAGSPIATVRRYDPSTNSWSAPTAMPSVRKTFAAGIVGDTIVYAAGSGLSGGTPIFDTTAYKGVVNASNPNAITWTRVADFPIRASRVSGGNMNDTVFVGFGEVSGQPRTKRIFGFGWESNSWIEYPQKPDSAISESVQLPSGSGMLFVPGGQYGLANSAISTFLHGLVFSSSLNVVSPNGAEIWQIGSQHQITWNQTGLENVNIEYTTNNGGSWVTVAENIPALGGYLWTVPNTPTDAARIRITGLPGSTTVDESDNTFAINRGGTPVTQLLVEGFNTPDFPPPGWLAIDNDGGGSTGPWGLGSTPFPPAEGSGYVASAYSGANNNYLDDWLASPVVIDAGVPGDQDSLTFYLRSVDNSPGQNFPDSVEVRLSTTGRTVGDFAILLEYINVPKTGWTRFGYRLNDYLSQPSNIYVAFRHLHYDGGENGTSSDYVGLDNVQILRYPPVVRSLTVLSPNGGETYFATQQHEIAWSQVNVDNVRLEYSIDGGSSWLFIAEIPGQASPYDWLVPNNASTIARVRVSSVTDTSVNDVSDYYFTIEGSNSVHEMPGVAPTQFALFQNYPNPFNPSTTFRFDLPVASHVRIDIFDVLGRRTGELVNSEIPAGSWNVEWSGSQHASGVYFYRMVANPLAGGSGFSDVKKSLLIK
jgi:hypothetical protein